MQNGNVTSRRRLIILTVVIAMMAWAVTVVAVWALTGTQVPTVLCDDVRAISRPGCTHTGTTSATP